MKAPNGHCTTKQDLTLMTLWVPVHVLGGEVGEADPKAASKLARTVSAMVYIVVVVCSELKGVLKNVQYNLCENRDDVQAVADSEKKKTRNASLYTTIQCRTV